MWVTAGVVVTVQLRRLMAVRDVMDGVARGQGPDGAAEPRLALRLADRAEPVVAGLNEKLDTLEDQVIEGLSALDRRGLADIRRVAIAPRHGDALSRIEDMPWIRPRLAPARRRTHEPAPITPAPRSEP